MTGASNAMAHLAGMLRGGNKSKIFKSKVLSSGAKKSIGKVKQLVRRVSSAGRNALKKGKIAAKRSAKQKELMTPMGLRMIGQSHVGATERRAYGAWNNSIGKGKWKDTIPSSSSLHRLHRLHLNATEAAEARGTRRKIGTGLALGAVGVGGYKLGKRKKKNDK